MIVCMCRIELVGVYKCMLETGHPLLLVAPTVPSIGRVHICSFVLLFLLVFGF